MLRIARKDSKSNFYHVIVQGINREYIFDTDFNIKKYKELIIRKKDGSTFKNRKWIKKLDMSTFKNIK